MLSQQKSIQKKRRRVHFSSQNDDVQSIQKNSCDENAKCWYSVIELRQMKDNTKIEAKSYKKELEIDGLEISSNNKATVLDPYRNSDSDRFIGILCQESEEETRSFRGLESVILPEFGIHKASYIKTLLKYQRKHNDLIKSSILQANVSPVEVAKMKEDLNTQLALICERMSRRFSDKARSLGLYDFTGTYFCSTDNKRSRKFVITSTSSRNFTSTKKSFGKQGIYDTDGTYISQILGKRINDNNPMKMKNKMGIKSRRKERNGTIWKGDYFFYQHLFGSDMY